ncbi:MAG: polysaccharide deacetylase family protein [Methanoregula sp.]|uniref:polysaccharide deacetylase family protein n=1 Tax=Methanoregula sp. TaxID=2052170 RepID=UPI003BB18795
MDKFGLYGINHFIEKFGIPIAINESSQSGIIISYGCPVRGNFVISIDRNEIQNAICGQVTTPLEKVSICEIPHNSGFGDEVIANFENGIQKYPCVVRKKNSISIGIDIFEETGYILSGHLDAIQSSHDQSIKTEIATQPSVDFLENILFEAILSGCQYQKIPLVQKSYWPEGKTFAVCLTHDVDEIKKTYQWISRPLKFILRKNLTGLEGQIKSFAQKFRGIEPYYTYEDIIKIERELSAKSTYFILKESGKVNPFFIKTWYLYGRNRSLQSSKMQALIRKLLENGDEVAIHGSYFSFKNPRLLQEEVQELEQLINEKILGTRQHNLNLEIPTTWHYQIDAGLKYDTTLGFKDRIGFRWGTSFPFYPNSRGEPISMLEIPTIIMDICLESSNNKESDCLQLAAEVERYHGVLNLLWHPPIFNELEYPEARSIYIKINTHCKTKEAWITNACNIYKWIALRNQFSVSYNFDPVNKTLRIHVDPEIGEQFLTLYLPNQTTCHIGSNNAKIIKADDNCVFIKINPSPDEKEIFVGLV